MIYLLYIGEKIKRCAVPAAWWSIGSGGAVCLFVGVPPAAWWSIGSGGAGCIYPDGSRQAGRGQTSQGGGGLAAE